MNDTDTAAFQRFCIAASEMYSVGMRFARSSDPHLHAVVERMIVNGGIPSITVVFQPALAITLHVSGTDEEGEPLTAEVCRYQSNVAAGKLPPSH